MSDLRIIVLAINAIQLRMHYIISCLGKNQLMMLGFIRKVIKIA